MKVVLAKEVSGIHFAQATCTHRGGPRLGSVCGGREDWEEQSGGGGGRVHRHTSAKHNQGETVKQGM